MGPTIILGRDKEGNFTAKLDFDKRPFLVVRESCTVDEVIEMVRVLHPSLAIDVSCCITRS